MEIIVCGSRSKIWMPRHIMRCTFASSSSSVSHVPRLRRMRKASRAHVTISCVCVLALGSIGLRRPATSIECGCRCWSAISGGQVERSASACSHTPHIGNRTPDHSIEIMHGTPSSQKW